jgi:hypothetical protein
VHLHLLIPLSPLLPSLSVSHTGAKFLYLHISTAKSNVEKYLQRTPFCKSMKVGFLLPEIGRRA